MLWPLRRVMAALGLLSGAPVEIIEAYAERQEVSVEERLDWFTSALSAWEAGEDWA